LLALLPLGGVAGLSELDPSRVPAQMSPCAQKVFGQVENNFRSNASYEFPSSEAGGHPNFFLSYTLGPGESNLVNDINAGGGIPFNSGFRSGIVSSLHVVRAQMLNGNSILFEAHLDVFNPLALYGLGVVPHVVVDYMLGHIIQWLGGGFGC